jgi:beta-fructofuranosidase
VNSQSEKINYESKVPKYLFPDTLDEQEKSLARNPMMDRFRESRASLSSDPHRPLYHFVSPEGMLNDPNGLCRWRGNWHLFYQGYPPEDPRQHWGHAVSADLVHWRDLPYAIYPNPEECCFSGSTLVEDDRVIAMYHGTKVGNMVAVSTDPLLLNWEKVAGKAVIPIESDDGTELPYRVHDPCIWSKDGTYFALSNGRDWWRDLDYLFRSEDLEHWEYLHPFIENDRFSLEGDDGACPYFWPIGNRHMLLFFSHMSGGQYFIGDYDTKRDKFGVTDHGKFNFQAASPSGVHAPSATPDGEGGIIVIFNMNPGRPAEGWNQIMTLPRRLQLAGSGELRIEPAAEVESLRRGHRGLKNRTIRANTDTLLDGFSGNAIELIAEIDTNGSPMVELGVLRSPDSEECTRIQFYRNRGYKSRKYDRECADSLITIDSSHSSILPDALSRAPETASVYLDQSERLRLRVFIDRSVVEVFVNDKQCVAMRVYPGREDSTGVSIRSQGRDIELISLDMWELATIY